MGVLYARVGGAWVPALGVNEVAVGTDAPTDPDVELWYDTDDPGLGLIGGQSAAYTPTLTTFVIGAGGVNNARYTYVGGPSVGDIGLINCYGRLVLGSSGWTADSSGPSLPTGFQFIQNAINGWNGGYVGQCRVLHGGAGWQCVMYVNTSTQASFVMPSVTATPGGSEIFFNNTTPWTWAAGDQFQWNFEAPVVRV